ncbi:hypothetical protein TNCV_98211 [Trichonephila clavipes]|nr:hypothetical protein TNCV_98211 [Trichonephila clavipes]
MVFRDESRFNLSSNEIMYLRGDSVERLNPVFALQRHTPPTAGVNVWVTLPTIHCYPSIDPWHHDSPAVCP